jgi:DNA-directed RNA polymerase subunit RPC12/RpoP
MKHIVYTCLHCGKQEIAQPDNDTVPPEWAQIQYVRYHTVPLEEATDAVVNGMVRTTLDTHACGDCAKKVLDYLEPPSQTARLESV